MTVQDLLRHTAGLAYGEITQNAPVKEALRARRACTRARIDYDARDLTPAEEVERLSKVPLAHQPGTVWEYSMASDCSAAWSRPLPASGSPISSTSACSSR